MPTIEPLKQLSYEYPQSKTAIMPRLPVRGLVLAPGSGGKTTMLVRMLVDKEFWGGTFSRIYWFSPSATVDEGLDALRSYVSKLQDQEEDPTFHDEFDTDFIRKLLDKQKKITEHLKRKGSNKRFNVILIIDDHADNQQAMHKAGGLLETLYVRARHFGVSTIVSSQRLKLISPTVKANLTALWIFRLRNHSNLLEGVIKEYSALINAKTLVHVQAGGRSTPWFLIYQFAI